MRFEGQIFRDGDFWLIEVPALSAMTQGRGRDEAFEMIRDLVETMADSPGFEVTVHPGSEDRFEISGSDDQRLVWRLAG
jgi:hypothetical protein